jgi:hypothetical protein
VRPPRRRPTKTDDTDEFEDDVVEVDDELDVVDEVEDEAPPTEVDADEEGE